MSVNPDDININIDSEKPKPKPKERIKIYPLKIILNTNENKQLELKPEMFIFDSGNVSGDGPYVCTNVLYSQSRLPVTHKERVELFMNKNKLNEFCNVSSAVKQSSDNKINIIETNISVMLKAIFPISFPIASNVISLCKEINMPSDNLFQQIPKLYGNMSTYLNIDKPKTVTNVVWLNVMHFHPEYIKLFKIVSEYYEQVENKYSETLNNLNEKKIKQKTMETSEKLEAITSMSFEDLPKKKTNNNTDNANNNNTDNAKLIKLTKAEQDTWKLYFMFKGMKKPSSEYNEFMEGYVANFISASKQSPSSKIYQSEESRQAANEKQFMESVEKELAFHFKYIKELVNYMPLERSSINTEVQKLFQNNMLNSHDFMNQMYPGNDTTIYCTTVDKMKDGEYYEIHLGISLVGGKVGDKTIFNSCKFNSYRLAKMVKDYNEGIPKYPAYPYVDLDEPKVDNEPKEPKAPKPKVEKKGGTKRRRNNRRRHNARSLKIRQVNLTAI